MPGKAPDNVAVSDFSSRKIEAELNNRPILAKFIPVPSAGPTPVAAVGLPVTLSATLVLPEVFPDTTNRSEVPSPPRPVNSTSAFNCPSPP